MTHVRHADRHGTPIELVCCGVGGTVTACVSGELDLDTVARIAPPLVRSLHDADRELALDLAGLSFCDSAGVDLFLRLDRLSRAEGKRLRLSHIPAQPARVIRTLGIQHRLTCDFQPA